MQIVPIYTYSLFAWAAFSFVSNSLLSIQHFLLAICFGFIIFKKEKLPIEKSTKYLLILSFLAIASILLNYSELIKPMSKILKVKYLLLGALGYGLSSNYAHQISKRRNQIIGLFLLSFLISVIYGLGHFVYSRLHGDFQYRPQGFFGMNLSYTYTSQIPILLIAFLVIFPQIKLSKNVGDWLSIFDSYLIRWTIFILSFVNLYFGQARGAFLGAVIALPLLILWKNKKVFYAISFSGLLIVALLVWNAFSGAIKTENRLFMSYDNSSNIERISQYKMAIAAFKTKPLTGVGWRSLDERSSGIKTKLGLPYSDTASHAHNNFLEVLATTGIFGLLFFFLWLWNWFREACLQNKSTWRSLYLAIIVSFILSGLFQSTFIDSEFAFTLFAIYSMTPLFKYE